MLDSDYTSDFVSHDLVFEEGQPCCTLLGVGEQTTTQISIFDVDLTNPPTDNSKPSDTSNSTVSDNQDHQLQNNVNQNTIPIMAINDQCQSTQVYQPSRQEYNQLNINNKKTQRRAMDKTGQLIKNVPELQSLLMTTMII